MYIPDGSELGEGDPTGEAAVHKHMMQINYHQDIYMNWKIICELQMLGDISSKKKEK